MSVSRLDGRAPDGKDFANYFCEYCFFCLTDPGCLFSPLQEVPTIFCRCLLLCCRAGTYAYIYHQVRPTTQSVAASRLHHCALHPGACPPLHGTLQHAGTAPTLTHHQTISCICLPLPAVSTPQKDMLEDHKRTGAYYNAVMDNKRLFKDKVVLDVGTGSGILAIFSAMAGARKVYAVEATDMAKNARKLVAANKVRQGRGPAACGAEAAVSAVKQPLQLFTQVPCRHLP
jgi:hypothetical protein